MEKGILACLKEDISNVAKQDIIILGLHMLKLYCVSKGIVSPITAKQKCPNERREDCSLKSDGMMSPEMVKVELRVTCIRAKMAGYKFLHRFLACLFPFKINLL